MTTTIGSTGLALSLRDRAALTAVAAGRCELVCGSEPDLLIDNRWFCDQARVHVLVAAGLLTPITTGISGRRVPAKLTGAGRDALDGLAHSSARPYPVRPAVQPMQRRERVPNPPPPTPNTAPANPAAPRWPARTTSTLRLCVVCSHNTRKKRALAGTRRALNNQHTAHPRRGAAAALPRRASSPLRSNNAALPAAHPAPHRKCRGQTSSTRRPNLRARIR
jgi:hypothetical protein